MANSGVFVLPRIIAPAAFSRATTVASLRGTKSSLIRDPPVVRKPAVSIVSLIVSGTPCNTPSLSPLVTLASASRARAIASGARVTIAFNCGLTRSMRCRWAATTSTGEITRVRINSASRLAVWEVISSISPDPRHPFGASSLLGAPASRPHAVSGIVVQANQLASFRAGALNCGRDARAPSKELESLYRVSFAFPALLNIISLFVETIHKSARAMSLRRLRGKGVCSWRSH